MAAKKRDVIPQAPVLPGRPVRLSEAVRAGADPSVAEATQFFSNFPGNGPRIRAGKILAAEIARLQAELAKK